MAGSCLPWQKAATLVLERIVEAVRSTVSASKRLWTQPRVSHSIRIENVYRIHRGRNASVLAACACSAAASVWFPGPLAGAPGPVRYDARVCGPGRHFCGALRHVRCMWPEEATKAALVTPRRFHWTRRGLHFTEDSEKHDAHKTLLALVSDGRGLV
jgi:hypothetical protein